MRTSSLPPLILCALLLAPTAVHATLLTAGVSGSMRDPGFPAAFECLQSETKSSVGAGASCGVISFAPSVGYGSGTAVASSSFGSLHALTDLVAGGGRQFGQNARLHVDAGGSFEDLWHISQTIGGVNTFFSGSVAVNAALNGVVFELPAAGASATAAGTLQLTGSSTSQGFTTCEKQILSGGIVQPVPTHLDCNVTVHFNPGDAVSIFMHLTALSDLSIPYNDPLAVPPSTGAQARADFSHSATITGITVYDATGVVLDDFTLLADSGTVYAVAAGPGPGGGTAPEPVSLALVGLGLAGLGWSRSKKT